MGSEGRNRPKGPPPEAVAACKDKSEGNVVEFVGPRGEKEKATVDRVYGIKDYSLSDSAFTTLNESNLMDQTGVETSYEDLSGSGWYFRLTNSGECVWMTNPIGWGENTVLLP